MCQPMAVLSMSVCNPAIESSLAKPLSRHRSNRDPTAEGRSGNHVAPSVVDNIQGKHHVYDLQIGRDA
jgi:hypothetical protein